MPPSFQVSLKGGRELEKQVKIYLKQVLYYRRGNNMSCVQNYCAGPALFEVLGSRHLLLGPIVYWAKYMIKTEEKEVLYFLGSES